MLELLISILVWVCAVSGTVLRYAPFGELCSPGKKRLLFTIYAAVGILSIVMMTVFLHLFGLATALWYLQVGGTVLAVLLSSVNILVIRGKLKEHLFVLGFVVTCHYLMLSTPAYVISLVELEPVKELFLFIGIYCAFLLLTHFPFRALLRRAITPLLQLEGTEYSNTVLYVPLAYFVAIISHVGASDTVDRGLQLISSLFSLSIMILMCLSVAADFKRIYTHKLIEKQLSDQQVHYAQLKYRVEEARKTKHDFKHHISAIRHYMDIDDKEGLRGYCDALADTVGNEDRIPYTGNAAADGVLYHYMQKSKNNGIQLHYSGVIRSPGISDMDISVCLGNALDNAFAGCMTIPEKREIYVMCQSEKHMVSILVRNSFDGEVKQNDEGLLSRKRENSPGIGIASMKEICERHGGIFDTKWDDTHFTVTILLPLKEEA